MPSDETVQALAARTADECARGDVSHVERALAALAGVDDPVAHAWAVLLQTQRRVAAGEVVLPTPDPSAPASARPLLARAAAVAARAAVLTWDRSALSAARRAHAASSDADDPAAAVTRDALACWEALLAGDELPVLAVGAGLAERAVEAGACEVEAHALGALFHDAAGDADAAIARAREACRRAQTGVDASDRALALIVLARLRRRSGRPQLALHILTGASEASAAARPWVAWEALLAGARTPATEHGRAPVQQATATLARLLDAAEAGNRVLLDTGAAEIASVLPARGDLTREAQVLIACVDPDGACVDPDVEAWARGDRITVPLGLDAIGLPTGAASASAQTSTFVVAGPARAARRVLRPGVALASVARNLEERADAGQAMRTETGLAVLALAPEAGVDRSEFFRAVYGFAFAPKRHQGVLDTLVHRMRGRLADSGDITRDDDLRIRLRLHDAIAVPDLRCELPAGDRVLRALSLLGTASAQATADAMGMPLRTVQVAMSQLVAEGACAAERIGKRVVYRVQDTTFKPPPR